MPPFDSEISLAPSLLDRLLDDDPRITSPLFTLLDLINPIGLVLSLKEGTDSVTALIRKHLSQECLAKIDAAEGITEIPHVLQEGIIEALNTLVDGDLVFEPDQFQEITLAEETIRLIEEKPRGRGLMFLNRMLLEDAYPRYLRTRRVEDTPFSLTKLKESVSRDLEALLNTRRELLEELSPSFKELNGSLLYYGLPDFTAMSLMSHKDRKKIRRIIEQTITTFEPRLKSVDVSVLNPSGLEQTLHFRIEALLQVEPEPEAVTFDAVLQLSTAKYDVRGSE